jgi:hypothetical protein
MVQRDTLESLRAELKPYGATLVAVSKTKPVADIRDAFELGLRDFGENYVQELAAKQEALPGDIRWHFIGHLQRNKVRTVAPLVHLVQSVDSPRLAHELHKQGVRLGRPVPGLLQVHIATEASKFGFGIAEAEAWVAEGAPATLDHLEVRGLMGMASFTDNTAQVRDEFRSLKNLFDRLAPSFARPGGDNPFTVLSMGMTGDYRIALDEGSNMVRIGSAIFGARK